MLATERRDPCDTRYSSEDEEYRQLYAFLSRREFKVELTGTEVLSTKLTGGDPTWRCLKFYVKRWNFSLKHLKYFSVSKNMWNIERLVTYDTRKWKYIAMDHRIGTVRGNLHTKHAHRYSFVSVSCSRAQLNFPGTKRKLIIDLKPMACISESYVSGQPEAWASK